MEVRVGLLFVLVLGASWACDARQLGNTKLYSGNGRIFEISVMQINYQDQDSKVQTMIEVSRNDNVCTLCEEFANQALDYLAENKTQTEVIVILHQTCSRIGSFQGEVLTSFSCVDILDETASSGFKTVSIVLAPEIQEGKEKKSSSIDLRHQTITI